ncbi:GGDEF domain-containing protein [Poseidonibacter antarcticus]|uniref:GGDEF domain-containing protein n=1 Tax=Poseidonibacter antarcticus TaxID=2478538 RepID=UPI000EF48949|nr:GGDEF domain-containing protein [Poseidonibacter antarcticus]
MKKLLIILLLIMPSFLFSSANESNKVDLSKFKWEYRLGDSPFENDIPLWTIDSPNSKWKEIIYPSNPLDRGDLKNVWYRVKLPEHLPADPNLYIFSIDFIVQVYLKNKLIYDFGEFDENAKGEFKGWPWHMISLPSFSENEYLYFRIYSNYIDIGLWGEILIDSKGNIYEKLLEHDIPKITIGSISIFVAVLFLISFLSRRKKIELLILGLLFLTQGLNVFFSAKILDIFLFYPLLKQYILLIVFFFFPIGMAMFMDKIITYKVPFNIIKRIWQFHLIYLLGAVFGSLLGFYSIASTYEYFDIFYNFITLPILTIFMVYFFFKGDRQTKIVTFSFFIISLYWVYSSLIAHGLVQWEEYPSDIAIFICLLLLTYSIVDNLNYTKELEEAKEELIILSSTDYLTKLNNRKKIDSVLEENEKKFKRYKDDFSIILLDIDDFKKINDKYGHLSGDEVLVGISNILTEFTREVDAVGRWGGEEFIIICPKTNKDEALVLAEKLRNKISTYDFKYLGNITASFGISTYVENSSLKELLLKADNAMYLSKSKGKNRVESI